MGYGVNKLIFGITGTEEPFCLTILQQNTKRLMLQDTFNSPLI